jgi:hypothetical protein
VAMVMHKRLGGAGKETNAVRDFARLEI